MRVATAMHPSGRILISVNVLRQTGARMDLSIA